MKRLSLVAGTITIVFSNFMLSASEFKPRQLSVESMRPVLDAVSRLDRVVVVPPSPYIRIGWPQICFLDSLKFRPLTQLLFRFKGNADWAIISDLPRACIITRLRVIPPDADAESLVAIAEDAAKRDIPKLSVYLNAAIGEAVRANGITVQPEPLELPLMHDAMDSPGVVYLVRDPTLFLESRLAPTSEYDRALHFWIGDQEEAKLREQLRVSDGEMSRLLNRLVNGSYGEAVINPEEVDQLLSECDYVNSASSDADIHAALIKIRSIANSAKNYRLGICLLGDS